LKGAERSIQDLAFSPDGLAIAAGFDEHHPVYLWNLDSASPSAARLLTATGYKRGGLQFTTDNRTLSWLTTSGRRKYDRDLREYTDESFAATPIVNAVVPSADGTRVISDHGFSDYCLIGWRYAEGEWIRSWTVPTSDIAVESLTLSTDGGLFAMIARPTLGAPGRVSPRHVEVRDGASGAVLGTGNYPYNERGPLLLAPDASQLVGSNDMTLMVWPVPALGEPRLVRNDTRKHFTAMAYHPAGRHLFATSNDETVHVFDATSWDRTARFTWQIGKLNAVAVSADGTLAAAGSDNGDIVIWDVDV
jgi:WD40 repeat protein